MIGNTINTTPAKGLSILQFLLLAVVCVAAFAVPAVVTGLWVLVVGVAVYGYFKNKMEYVWYTMAASPALEIWARMSSAPFLPYESGKYFLLFCIGLLLLQLLSRKSPYSLYSVGWFISFLLLPSLIVGIAHFDMEQWVFNTLSVIELAILLIFASRERWHIERFCKTLQYSMMAIICLLIYITLKVPALGELEFSLKANSSASGGFGSNQVSSVLGAGIVLTTLLLILNRPFFAIRWLNHILLAYLLFRGLLTFSRGGMVVAIVAVIIAMVPRVFASFSSFIKYTTLALLFAICTLLIFYKVNDITGNMLLLRYQGETAGTYAGSKTKSLNTILSGREDIAASDIEIFRDYWLFGASPGQSKLLRRSYGYDIDVAAHTEFTRLLSEHGLGGLLVDITIFLFPIYWIRKQHIKAWRGVLAALFTLAILTAFHAAMRTNITVMFYVLASIPVLYETSVSTKKHLPEDDSLHR